MPWTVKKIHQTNQSRVLPQSINGQDQITIVCTHHIKTEVSGKKIYNAAKGGRK